MNLECALCSEEQPFSQMLTSIMLDTRKEERAYVCITCGLRALYQTNPLEFLKLQARVHDFLREVVKHGDPAQAAQAWTALVEAGVETGDPSQS